MKKIIVLALIIFSFGKINAQNKKGDYRLVVEFISKGSGIDHKSMEKIDKFISSQKKTVGYEVCHAGREGETSYLFQLKELSKKEQKKFVKEIKNCIVEKDMVHVDENRHFDVPCR